MPEMPWRNTKKITVSVFLKPSFVLFLRKTGSDHLKTLRMQTNNYVAQIQGVCTQGEWSLWKPVSTFRSAFA
jgi:hypothetical protein